jgi:hypothetical protein
MRANGCPWSPGMKAVSGAGPSLPGRRDARHDGLFMKGAR